MRGRDRQVRGAGCADRQANYGPTLIRNAENDPDLPKPLRDFLLLEASEGWLHVTPDLLDRFRETGTHHG